MDRSSKVRSKAAKKRKHCKFSEFLRLELKTGTHRLFRCRAEGRMHSSSSRIVLETSLSQKPRETMSTMVVKAVRHLEMQISERSLCL